MKTKWKVTIKGRIRMSSDNWYEDFKSTLKKREKKLEAKLIRHYDKQYSIVLRAYSHQSNPEVLAKKIVSTGMLKRLYTDIYEDIYPAMGMWSLESETKSLFSDIRFVLKEKAKALAVIMFTQRGDLIQSNQRGAILAVLQRLQNDPEFATLNERQTQARLRLEFSGLSRYQAARIIRTESTNAANAGVLKAAKLQFPDRMLYKRWISSNDSRTRKQHKIYKNKFNYTGLPAVVPEYDQFMVVGELVDHPGGGRKPSNNIYCRCAVAITRKKDG